MVETPRINFVVGKNEEPKLDKTVEIETETFNSMARDIVNTVPKKKTGTNDTKNNAGFVSYILLGVVSFAVSLLLLFLFIR